jgi:hypothetical protein
MSKNIVGTPQNHVSLRNNNLFQSLFGKVVKPAVSENAIFLHNRKLAEVEALGKTIKFADSTKFSSQEFLQLVKLKYQIGKGAGEFAGLSSSLQLFVAAVKAQELFLKIDQTEIRYRGSKQQEFYQFTEKLLTHPEDQEHFRQQVQIKLTQLLADVKSEEGKKSLQSYADNLVCLSEYELGLKLLALFKSYQLSDYTVLRRIAELIDRLLSQKQDLHDLKELVIQVLERFDDFEKVGRIIGIDGEFNVPETYARMVQYVALLEKHQKSFGLFEKLLLALQKWNKPYQMVVGVRWEYPATEYQQPKEFSQAIAGEELYLKYKQNLTDPTTGEVYANFGDEEAQAEFFREFGIAAARKEQLDQEQRPKLSVLQGSLILLSIIVVPVALGVGAIKWVEATKAKDTPVEAIKPDVELNQVEKGATQNPPKGLSDGDVQTTPAESTPQTSLKPEAASQDEAELQVLQEQMDKRKSQLEKTNTMLKQMLPKQ